MVDKDKILIENLRETLKQIQRYLILGLGSALILLSIIIQSPVLTESGAQVSLPFIGLVDLAMGAFTLIIAGFVFGAIAVSGVNRVKQIILEITDEALAESALTFPTLITIRSRFLRIGVVVSPVFLLVIGYLIEQARIAEPFDPSAILGIAIISSPYLVLAYIVWRPVQVDTTNES